MLEALEAVQVLDVEGPLFGRQGRGDEDKKRGQNAKQTGHGLSWRPQDRMATPALEPPWYPGP